MFSVALIAKDPLYASWLADVLGDDCELHWLRPDDPEDPAVDQIARLDPPDAILVEPDNTLIRTLTDASGALLAAVSMDSPGDAAISLVRAGAADIFVMGRDDREIRTRLDTLLRERLQRPNREPALPTPRSECVITTLLGPGGHGDLAFCAVHLALALMQQARPGDRVLVLDLGQPCGASMVHLDLTQSYSLLDAINDTYRCDASLIDSAFSRHGSDGVFLLSLPEDQIGPAPVGETEMAALLGVLREHFRHIVCAVGPQWPMSVTRALLSYSTYTAMVSDGGIVNSRTTRAFLHALRQEDVSLAKLGLICDSARGIQALDASNLARLLELPLWTDLRGSPQARARAVNRGEPLFNVAPRDASARSLVELAGALHARKDIASAPRSSSFWQRLSGG